MILEEKNRLFIKVLDDNNNLNEILIIPVNEKEIRESIYFKKIIKI